MVERLPVYWSKNAEKYLAKAIGEIRKDSYQNAEKVKLELLAAVRNLPENPKCYPIDKFKIMNPGNYRSFEMPSLRIFLSSHGERNQGFTDQTCQAGTENVLNNYLTLLIPIDPARL